MTPIFSSVEVGQNSWLLIMKTGLPSISFAYHLGVNGVMVWNQLYITHRPLGGVPIEVNAIILCGRCQHDKSLQQLNSEACEVLLP